MPHAPIVIPIPIPVGPHKIPMLHWTFWSFTLTKQQSGFVGEVIFGFPQLVIGGNAPPVANLPAGLHSPEALDDTYIVGISVAQLNLFGCDGTNFYSQSAVGGKPNIAKISSVGSGNYKSTWMTLKNGTATLHSLAVVVATAQNPTAAVLSNGQGPGSGDSLYFTFEDASTGTWSFYKTWSATQTMATAWTAPYSRTNPPLVASPFPSGGIFIPSGQGG